MKKQQTKIAVGKKQSAKDENCLKLNDENLKAVKKIADHFGCSNDDAVNIMLSSVDFKIEESKKPEVEIK